LSSKQERGTIARPEQRKPWYKRWWGILILVLIGVSLLNAIINPSDSDEEEVTEESDVQGPDSTQQESNGSPAPDGEEDAEASESEKDAEGEVETLDYEINYDPEAYLGAEAWIEFELQDHFTAGLMANQAQRTAADGLQAAYAEHPDADRYVVGIPSQDEDSASWLSNAAFDPVTVEDFDFEDPTLNVFEHLDAGSAHPDLLD